MGGRAKAERDAGKTERGRVLILKRACGTNYLVGQPFFQALQAKAYVHLNYITIVMR